MKYRISVEKKEQFRIEARQLETELNESFGLDIKGLRIINIYDVEGFNDKLIERTKYGVFGEMQTDLVSVLDEHEALMEQAMVNNPIFGPTAQVGTVFAIEPVPGQFDQRAASAEDCVRLIDPSAKVKIATARMIIFPEPVDDDMLARIKHYCINAVECREKNMKKVGPQPVNNQMPPIREFITDFRTFGPAMLQEFIKTHGLSINLDDMFCIQEYFRQESREPTLTEIMILDTYWSDHCRHTTFSTVLDNIEVEDSFVADEIRGIIRRYDVMRRSVGRSDRDHTLMDMATIGAKWLSKNGRLTDLEQSEENNACSIYITINVRRGDETIPERWLLQYKNETHNHPTEIEPFGGAATCLGGAIRDPLSGRAYVYQAMRVTGAGDIYKPVSETMPGKLPQRVISRKAAQGYSSYGNQIGLATTCVREVYHPDYVAKRLEVGAVVGAVKADDVRRLTPQPGDIVLMLGGRTGRDGVGGATGASKKHDDHSLETCGSEVQKGNAPEERKLQRLMRRKDATKLIKKANDFGAGGVSVAVGELADGLDIFLDRVKTKYEGLSTTELAISESQERMAVVVDANDAAQLAEICRRENIEVVHIANVTAGARMRIIYNDTTIVDLKRSFIDSAGAKRHSDVIIKAVEDRNPFFVTLNGNDFRERFENNLKNDNVLTQKGLAEMFDASIGASTVLMPFGGKLQHSESQVSVQKIPVLDGETNDASMMAYGFDPELAKWSPYHGACYAVVHALAKIVAAGGTYNTVHFSFQEYFQKMTDPESWGLPTAALLGAIKMQRDFKLAAIGGKDSMSGTFDDINVPPTFIAFGITQVNVNDVISTDFHKEPGIEKHVYLLRHRTMRGYLPDTMALKHNFDLLHRLIHEEQVDAAYAVERGGVGAAIAKMSFGSNVGANISYRERDIFTTGYGNIVFTSERADLVKLDTNIFYLGNLRDDDMLVINNERFDIVELYRINTERFGQIYPDNKKTITEQLPAVPELPKVEFRSPLQTLAPIVFIPVFPGTNCDYDLARAFREAGAEVRTQIFRNLTSDDITSSISEMADNIRQCNILALAGGFSSGDEPDGSAKFIATVLNNDQVATQVEALIARKGLILGICNGFQALVKSGLLPYGHLGTLTHNSPTLFRNDCNRHISQMVTTRVCSVRSPWLQGFSLNQEHTIPISHGEGKFVCSRAQAEELRAKDQIAFQYVENPNGSTCGIEGIISEDGLILGKMGHSERRGNGLYLNIQGNTNQDLFRNAVNYFRNK